MGTPEDMFNPLQMCVIANSLKFLGLEVLNFTIELFAVSTFSLFAVIFCVLYRLV